MVVNKKTYSGPGIYIGRPSGVATHEHYGNPFTFKAGTKAKYVVGGRKECIDCYKWWIRGLKGVHQAVDAALADPDLIRQRNWIIRQLHAGALVGQTLICWCKNEGGPDVPCHGDVLETLQKDVVQCQKTNSGS